MVAVSSGGLTANDAGILSRGRVGSVILLGNSTAGARATKRLTAQVRAATHPPSRVQTMLAADQEGGLVQRLRGNGFETIPSARRQATWSAGKLTRGAHRWGRQLKVAGIDANLAPVADVVPTSLEHVNQPIGVLNRGYGPNPTVVAAKVAAFNRGMHEAGIATAVKHFPGLGRVRGNTDLQAHVLDHTTTRHDPALAGFAAGVKGGVDMVMVSSATYTQIDSNHRAAFSKIVIDGMIRHDLGFERVVISDDLAAAAFRGLTSGERGLRFLQAGGDLMIAGNPTQTPAMIAAITAQAKADPVFAATLTTKATRVIRLKASHGLADCSG
jgi:beta-N-acetylhexosaminidase